MAYGRIGATDCIGEERLRSDGRVYVACGVGKKANAPLAVLSPPLVLASSAPAPVAVFALSALTMSAPAPTAVQ